MLLKCTQIAAAKVEARTELLEAVAKEAADEAVRKQRAPAGADGQARRPIDVFGSVVTKPDGQSSIGAGAPAVASAAHARYGSDRSSAARDDDADVDDDDDDVDGGSSSGDESDGKAADSQRRKRRQAA